MTQDELDLRRRIFEAFAEFGVAPDVRGEDPEALAGLERAHVIVRDESGAVVMAHPFAKPCDNSTRVEQNWRSWHGSCAWDGFGIAAALDLEGDYAVVSNGLGATDEMVFHVAVPATHWWDDIAFT